MVNPDEIVLQLASEIVSVLLSLKMCEKFIEEEEL
jgi:hypothetical protein